MKKIANLAVVFTICVLLLSACSINQLAMRAVANALTGEGSSDVFTGDNDPQLVWDALPFAIKIYEALLDANPNHQALMLTTGSLFVMYANAFIQGPAEILPTSEWEARENGMLRAKNLYLRGVEILYNGIEARHKGFKQAASDSQALSAFLNRFTKDDVPFLYWAVAGGLASYSIDLLDFELNSRIPEWSALIHRAYELDPDFQGVALDEFLIIFYASLPEIMGGDVERAKLHFQRVQEKTDGKSAGAYVSYAQSICVSAYDYDTFKDYLEKALAINPDDNISTRLVTIINQRKARWLLDNAWTLFSFLPIPDDY